MSVKAAFLAAMALAGSADEYSITNPNQISSNGTTSDTDPAEFAHDVADFFGEKGFEVRVIDGDEYNDSVCGAADFELAIDLFQSHSGYLHIVPGRPDTEPPFNITHGCVISKDGETGIAFEFNDVSIFDYARIMREYEAAQQSQPEPEAKQPFPRPSPLTPF